MSRRQQNDQLDHRLRSFFAAGTLLAIATGLVFATPQLAMARNVVGKPVVVDGDTIAIGDTIVRIAGIDAPESDQRCLRDNGHKWNCGKAAGTELKRAIGDQTVSCSGDQHDQYGRLIAACRLGRVDIGGYLVTRGLALAYVKFADTYVAQEQAARSNRRGIWSGSFENPHDHRREKWQQAELAAPKDGCPIKGNINKKGVRIYHAPWSRAYHKTKINTKHGERWFCTEQEAANAGWRPPRHH